MPKEKKGKIIKLINVSKWGLYYPHSVSLFQHFQDKKNYKQRISMKNTKKKLINFIEYFAII